MPTPATIDLTEREQVELDLIQQDTRDALVVALGHRHHHASGVLSLVGLPFVGLVVLESDRYFRDLQRRHSLVGNVPEVDPAYDRAITKVRSRMKLFDDTDGGRTGLQQLLAAAHAHSRAHFQNLHGGVLWRLVRGLQPDLGVFFSGEHIIATSHTLLPALGAEVATLSSFLSHNGDASKRATLAFGEAIGRYAANMARFLGELGRPVSLAPPPVNLEGLAIVDADFVGAQLYAHLRGLFGLEDDGQTAALLMIQSHLNTALHVLPRLLPPDSNLLLRGQFLTQFHARAALLELVPSRAPTPLRPESPLRSRWLRNTMAHYGLRTASVSTLDRADSLGSAISQKLGVDRQLLSEGVRQELVRLAEPADRLANDSTLVAQRSLWGSHLLRWFER